MVTDGASSTRPVKVRSIDRQNDDLITLEAIPAAARLDRRAAGSFDSRVPLRRRAAAPARPGESGAEHDRHRSRGLRRTCRSTAPQPLLRAGDRLHMEPDEQSRPPTTIAARRCVAADRRSEGESAIHPSLRPRHRDEHGAAGRGRSRLCDRVRAARRGSSCCRSTGGDDVLGAAVSDLTYIGDDNVEPEQRTGLFTLRNIEEISIVAAPGRTSAHDAERADRPLRADALPVRGARRPAAARTTRSPTSRCSASSSTPSTRRSTTPGC